jgi:hypothetical protein
MNSSEAFQICPSHTRLNRRQNRDEYCGLLAPAGDGSLLFGTWRRLGFAAAPLDGSFLIRNILADL